MSEAPLDYEKHIEPAAVEWSNLGDPADGTFTETTTLSIAISLKRIADAMTAPVNEYGENMSEAIGGEMRRASQDISSIVHNAMNAGRRG